MSLIRDALKEAQKKREEKKGVAPSHPSLPSSRKKRKFPFLSLVILSILFLLFFVYVYIQMEKIAKVQSKKALITSNAYGTTDISMKEVSKNYSTKASEEKQEKSEIAPPPLEKTKEEKKEEVKIPSPTSDFRPLPKKAEPKKFLPEEFAKEEKNEREEGKIEIIRSPDQLKKSQIVEEEELLEIEKCERNHDWDRACSLWEKVLEKNEKKEYLLNAGVAFKNKGDLKKAEELFLKAISLDPSYLSAINNLGVLYLEMNNYDKAIEFLSTALKIYPEDPEVHVNIGIGYYKKKELEKAKKHFEQAIKLRTEIYQAYYYLGIIYLNQKDKEKALICFTKFLQLVPEDFPPDLKRWVKEKIDLLRVSK